MSYPFISLEIEIVLGLVAAAAGLALQGIDEPREHHRGHVPPLQRQLQPHTALRDLGLTRAPAAPCSPCPDSGPLSGFVSMPVGINDLEPRHAPPFVIAIRDLLSHATSGVLTAPAWSRDVNVRDL
ncbi:MAG TPA: hypothetical protein VFG15_03470 [Amycolatopsis sp.]|nr:hypothetical protein [Amycolatopsis sp.]